MFQKSRDHINLMQLKFFLVVAEFQNISKAAEHLFRTQSAITRAISDLEKQLNVELFERHHNGVILTEIGNFLHPTIENSINEIKKFHILFNVLTIKIKVNFPK